MTLYNIKMEKDKKELISILRLCAYGTICSNLLSSSPTLKSHLAKAAVSMACVGFLNLTSENK
jgi:hypothetical protein